MTPFHVAFKRFRTRVRLVRSWKSMAVGTSVGASAALILAFLDWRNLVLVDPIHLIGVTVAGLVIGGLLGLVRRVEDEDLARSLDRRAGLEDRLATALEHEGDVDGFGVPLQDDADQRLSKLEPRRVYPVRLTRWHGGAVGLMACAAALFLLGNTPLLLSTEEQAERKELQRAGQAVERVLRPIEKAKAAMTEAEKATLRDLERFSRELEKGRVTKEAALQKANELMAEAERLAAERFQAAEKNLLDAQTARQKLEQDALERAGLPRDAGEMAKATPEQLQTQRQELSRQLEELAKEMEAAKANGSDSESLKRLQEQVSKLQESLQKLELSKEAQETLEKLRNDPRFKELQELAQKLQQQMQQSQESGQPQISPEDLEKMREQLEQLMEQLKDDEAMQEYLQALKEALENAQAGGQGQSVATALAALFNLPGGNGRSQDDSFQDTGTINKLDQEAEGKGKTAPTSITGARDDERGTESYIEIKAPTKTGSRTSVPYRNVLPNYKKRAEEALNRRDIPKRHEKRVREYFQDLEKR
ncbi:MAG TPA: YlbF family regulator [Fimbriimonadaceae bacterium]|nr:YlbF family regulator [Fimbriimonadaceae bacterium]